MMKFNYFEIIKTENTISDINLENIQACLDFLQNFNENSTDFLKSQECYESFFYIGKKLSLSNLLLDKINFAIFIEKKFEVVLGNVLMQLFEISDKLDFLKNSIAYNEPTKNASINEKCISFFCYSFFIMNKIISRYTPFVLQFQATNGLQSIFLILKNEKFLKKTFKIFQNTFLSGNIPIIDNIVLNVYLISKSSDNFKYLWRESNSVIILLNVAKVKLSTIDDVFCTVVNIIDDKQIEILQEIQTISLVLLEQFNTCVNNFSRKEFQRRSKQIMEENTIMKVEIHYIRYKNSTLSMLKIFNNMYLLSINEKIRVYFYFKKHFMANLKAVLFLGNNYEKKILLKLVAMFSFSVEIAHDMLQDKEFLAILNEISSKSEKKNATEIIYDLKPICEIIHWNLISRSSKESEIKAERDRKQKREYIFISNNQEEHKNICSKIKFELEKFGYKVFINENNNNDSFFNFKATINFIEECYFFIVVASEKYRKSICCQVELQYASNLNKRIISLISQKGYEYDIQFGWMGKLLNQTKKIDFSINDFNKSISCLMDEIDPSMKKVKIKEEPNVIEIQSNVINDIETDSLNEEFNRLKSDSQPKSWIDIDVEEIINNQKHASNHKNNFKTNNPENMSEFEVRTWLHSNKINESIIKYLLPCDGEVLRQIFEMRKRNPILFDRSFFKIRNLNFVDVAKFSVSLEKLFKANKDD